MLRRCRATSGRARSACASSGGQRGPAAGLARRREAPLRQRDRVPAAARRRRPAQRGGLLQRRQRRAGRGRAAAAQRAAAGRDPADGHVGSWSWEAPGRPTGCPGPTSCTGGGRPGAAVGDGYPAALAGRHPPRRPGAGPRRADPGVHPTRTVRAGPADDADHWRGGTWPCAAKWSTTRRGRPARVWGSAQDVTERHRVQEELRRILRTDPLTALGHRLRWSTGSPADRRAGRGRRRPAGARRGDRCRSGRAQAGQRHVRAPTGDDLLREPPAAPGPRP